jgi:hypothetical protein
VEPDCGQCQLVVGLCLWIIQGDGMSGEQVFKQVVAFADQAGRIQNPITADAYELWKKDYIWESLHGIRYGQSFCNHFGITDNHLYYGTSGIEWADQYIKKTYLA